MRYIHGAEDVTVLNYGRRPIPVLPGSVILTPDEVDHLHYNVLPAYRDEIHDCARRAREAASHTEDEGQRRAFLQLANSFDRQVNKTQEWMAILGGGKD